MDFSAKGEQILEGISNLETRLKEEVKKLLSLMAETAQKLKQADKGVMSIGRQAEKWFYKTYGEDYERDTASEGERAGVDILDAYSNGYLGVPDSLFESMDDLKGELQKFLRDGLIEG